ncbi:antibiotic biosynthesis monooxygenase [Phycicoccus sp. CSK15P-2]|uniref:antibiotic biosynthesis monooxygenase n=1 Tax=Phycicoccus sp. CSK15P-2 TaxID=2807627 RepID=UPI0019507880|nr:antibiotic biosynthesis monooxygenase [Phycicoccus sp. CSK15P-2]MBM6403175.1 antibiotic biosynthesis monooxygenase [Phycicoccus sp. CSK15P-2]
MTGPVTVSVTRHLDPGHEPEMTSWVQAGTALAQRFPGFLGAGWVRPGPDSGTWHMLYRFADADSLARWEASQQRAWWRDSAAGLGVVESRVERRTGIEGWFDEPALRDVDDLRPQPVAPPRWKQAVTIFLVFFPLSLLVNWLVPHVGLDTLPLVPRVLVTILVMTPTMTYLALPWVTRRMSWFLQGEPPPWRR